MFYKERFALKPIINAVDCHHVVCIRRSKTVKDNEFLKWKQSNTFYPM